MNWKKFLKPNKQKTIILIILSFLIPFPYIIIPIAYGVRPVIYFLWVLLSIVIYKLGVLFLVYSFFLFLIPFLITYLITCLLYRYIKFTHILLILLCLTLLLSIFPVYKDVEEGGSSKSYTFIEQFTKPIKSHLQRRKFEKFTQEGDIVKLINIKDEYFVESKGYYVINVLFEGREIGLKIYATLCTKSHSWIKEGTCYRYKPEEEMRKDVKFNIRSDGGDCYTGILEEVSCE